MNGYAACRSFLIRLIIIGVDSAYLTSSCESPGQAWFVVLAPVPKTRGNATTQLMIQVLLVNSGVSNHGDERRRIRLVDGFFLAE